MNSTHLSEPWIGRRIGDGQRYRIDKRLGMGGMADVFLATDTLIGKQVALKLLKDTFVGSADLRRRFEREVTVS
ncbi:MAG: serine/threonine protein kinase, partial [Nostoc sp.]